MKLPKIQKNSFNRYLSNRKLSLGVSGFSIRVDWLIILGGSLLLLLFLLWSSLSLFKDVSYQIKGDDFVPKLKTVNDAQLKRVINEIDSKKNSVILEESSEVIDDSL